MISSAAAGGAVRVRVPATTANLGPGFDALGMALSLYNCFELELLDPADGCVVEATGPEADLVPKGEDNLVIQGAAAAWAAAGMPRTGWRVRLETEIPFGGGLGSSASAIVGGVVGANALAGRRLSVGRMLALATELEGHPDNVAPALLGGVTVVVKADDGAVHWERIPVRGLQAVVAVPHRGLSTGRSRQALPEAVPYKDAVFNVGRVSLLVAALAAGRPEALSVALEDRLHQPYRAKLVPGFADVVAAAVREGALGAALSGAGPSVVAFVAEDADAAAVGVAMTAAFLDSGVGADWIVLHPDEEGAVVEMAS